MIESGHVIENTARLIGAARKVSIPVIITRIVHWRDKADRRQLVADFRLHGPERGEMTVEETPGADVIDGLNPLPTDYIITKRRASSFYGTDLEVLLHARGIDTLIVTGGCVENTFRDAADRDFNLIVASDCCAGSSRQRHANTMKGIFSSWGRVRRSDEIIVFR